MVNADQWLAILERTSKTASDGAEIVGQEHDPGNISPAAPKLDPIENTSSEEEAREQGN